MHERMSAAYCESVTHEAMIHALMQRGLARIDVVFSPADRPSFDAPGVEAVRLPDGAGRTPSELWRSIKARAFEALDQRDLILFQDQSWPAQAVSAAAVDRGARRTLIQDGFLSFDDMRAFGVRRFFWPMIARLDRFSTDRPRPRLRLFKNAVLHNQHFFGVTRPDRILVFGDRQKQRLTRQFGIDPETIFVTGPLLRPPPIARFPNALIEEGRLRVLLLDQCFLRYGRMPRRAWTKAYLPMVEALRTYQLIVKPHPAQTDAELSELKASAGPSAVFQGRDRLAFNAKIDADVAVTVSSTAFITCLAAGVPVIFFDAGARDKMPDIHHPLIAAVDTVQGLRDVLEHRRTTGDFKGKQGYNTLNLHLNLENFAAFEQVLSEAG